jgi:molybdopterin molybdotransferase
MISVQEASQIVKENLTLIQGVLSNSIVADRDYPPFDRVMMDGIAVRFEDYQKGTRDFVVSGVQAAGEAAKTLSSSNGCLEVMTGAPLPSGCDLVIPYEHVEIKNEIATVVLEMERVHYENIHHKGSDCKKGEVVLNAGVFINGPHQGIAASMGITPKLSNSSKILIISTGDELVEVNETPLDHQIRRSNAHALKKSLELAGISNVTLNHLKDDVMEISEHYKKSAKDFDVMIYSGGVSKGKFDYLPNVWIEMGVKKYFHEVAQRPGKPLWFGHDEKNNTHVVGLPGNPVSSLVCLHRYLIPARKMFVRLKTEVVFKKALTYFLPVKIEFNEDGGLDATPLKIKNSGEFTALAESDGFIELPAEKNVFSPGEVYSFYGWSGL